MVSQDLFLNLAMEYSLHSTCIRRRYGCVIVDSKFNDPVCGGFNGAPCGMPHCTDVNRCVRQMLKMKPGESPELCFSAHAEQNALIKAGRRAYSCDMYLYGWDVELNREIIPKPCILCTKMLINANVSKVITRYTIFDPIELYREYVNEINDKYNNIRVYDP